MRKHGFWGGGAQGAPTSGGQHEPGLRAPRDLPDPALAPPLAPHLRDRLETYLLHPSSWLFLGVGLIGEAAKPGGLILVARRMGRRHAGDGFVLGAAVGFGFAAFETAGYVPRPTDRQQHLYTVLSDGGLAAVALLGVLTLLLAWRMFTRAADRAAL